MGKIRRKAVLFSAHILDRSKERGVSISDIKKVIANPKVKYETKTGNVHLEAELKGRRVVVIVAEYAKHFVGVSCWRN